MAKVAPDNEILEFAIAREVEAYNFYDVNSALDMDYKDVLMLGIEKEEASFRTYVNLLPSIHDQESREVILAIAEEEVKHKLCFETEYDLLLKKS